MYEIFYNVSSVAANNASWVAGTLVNSISQLPLDGSSGFTLLEVVGIAGALGAGAVGAYNYFTKSGSRTGELSIDVGGSKVVFDGSPLRALEAHVDGGNTSPSAVNRSISDFRDRLLEPIAGEHIKGVLLLEDSSAEKPTITPKDAEHLGEASDILLEAHSDPERVENDPTWRQTIMEKLNDLASKLSEGLSNFKSWLQDLGRAIMNVVHFKPESDTPAPR